MRNSGLIDPKRVLVVGCFTTKGLDCNVRQLEQVGLIEVEKKRGVKKRGREKRELI